NQPVPCAPATASNVRHAAPSNPRIARLRGDRRSFVASLSSRSSPDGRSRSMEGSGWRAESCWRVIVGNTSSSLGKQVVKGALDETWGGGPGEPRPPLLLLDLLWSPRSGGSLLGRASPGKVPSVG